jgi:hypothetical protein
VYGVVVCGGREGEGGGGVKNERRHYDSPVEKHKKFLLYSGGKLIFYPHSSFSRNLHSNKLYDKYQISLLCHSHHANLHNLPSLCFPPFFVFSQRITQGPNTQKILGPIWIKIVVLHVAACVVKDILLQCRYVSPPQPLHVVKIFIVVIII